MTFTMRSFEAEGAAIVQRARDAARRILRLALEEAERQKQKARVEGRAAGFEEGQKQGVAAAEKRAAEQTRTLAQAHQAAAAAIAEERAALRHAAERELFALATAMAETIVRARVETDSELAARAVRDAIAIAGSRRTLHVHLNPVDYDAMKPADTEAVLYTADPSVARGGCLVRAETGDVDAQIETQLRNLKEALHG